MFENHNKDTTPMEHVVIIGNGISGITAARHVRKLSRNKITVISEETDFFFSRTALMYVYMGHMKFEHTQPYENHFWDKNDIQLVKDRATSINTQEQSISIAKGMDIKYDHLILATGSSPNKFGWPGQDLDAVQGLYFKQDLESMEKWSPTTKRAVIVGGGLIGIEMAEMFRTRNIEVTMLVRETNFWNSVLPTEEAKMINRHIAEHHIDLRLETELKEILSDENGRAKAVITNTGEQIDCEFVGLTVGVHPNIEFVKNAGIESNRGILVNRKLETSAPHVYAIGDCAEQREAIGSRRALEQVWYTGRMMGETVAQTICGNPIEYQPGHWFNSAKFLDIEYQTYGWVWAKRKEEEDDFYWEHHKGKKCIRIVYHKDNHTLIGINVFGIRLRHEICDQWLRQNATVEQVLKELPQANFDPEFYAKHEKEIKAAFNQKMAIA
jgi:NAD(P)H-nitrite reductase large subunit